MSNVTRAALAECPFCGSAAYSSFHGADRARVKCLESDCGAEVSAYSKPSAIEKWNHRAALTATDPPERTSVADLERLGSAMREVKELGEELDRARVKFGLTATDPATEREAPSLSIRPADAQSHPAGLLVVPSGARERFAGCLALVWPKGPIDFDGVMTVYDFVHGEARAALTAAPESGELTDEQINAIADTFMDDDGGFDELKFARAILARTALSTAPSLSPSDSSVHPAGLAPEPSSAGLASDAQDARRESKNAHLAVAEEVGSGCAVMTCPHCIRTIHWRLALHAKQEPRTEPAGAGAARPDVKNETGVALPSAGLTWISVDERMPEPFQSVALVNVNRWENVGDRTWDRNTHACGYFDNWAGGFWSIRGERAQSLDAWTHWLSLPEPPTASPQVSEPAEGTEGRNGPA